MKRAELVWVGVILLFALAIRVISLDADPPSWLSWSAGIYTDEGIYNEDARLFALYHQHMQGDFHVSVVAPLHNMLMLAVYETSQDIHHDIVAHERSSAQSPKQSYEPLVIGFDSVVKTSLKTVRMVSVLFSIGTLIAFWVMLRNWFDSKTALIGLAFLATSVPYVLYNRLGLLETPALFWMVLAYLCFSKSGDKANPNYIQLGLTGLFAGISVAWKGTFLLAALPLIYIACISLSKSSLTMLITFAVIIGLYVAIFVVPNYAEYSRDNHYYLIHQYLPHSIGAVWFNLHRGLLTGEDDGEIPYLLTRSTLPVLILVAFIFLHRSKPYSMPEKMMILWIAIPMLVFLFCSYTPSRYLVMILPPITGLAAYAISTVKKQQFAQAFTFAVVAVNIGMFGLFWTHRTYTINDASAKLQHVLPNDAWIAGQFAPELCLANSLRSMYVQKGLANDSLATISSLPITHVLATQTLSESADPWAGEYNMLIPSPGGLKTVTIGKQYGVNVYANQYALP